jgi:beta-lactamase regulating signal transducer with metallopeptidase domain
MKRLHPRLRHLLWLAAICSFPLAMALAAAGPAVLFTGQVTLARSGGIVGTASSVLLPDDGALLRSSSSTSVVPGVRHLITWARVWPGAVVAVWLATALAIFTRVCVGWIQLLQFIGRSDPRGTRRHERLARDLAARIGIRRGIRVVENRDSEAPFTGGLVHPAIVLPAAMRDWPDGRLRAVLLHELRHIRRVDCLTQTVAYLACSLFWFVPFVWIAYAHLYLEQEKACDACVVETGMGRRAYASCILDAVRLCREPALVAGLFFGGRRKKMLADRIHSILRGGSSMKKGLAVFVLAALVVCALVFLSAAGQKELSGEEVWSRFVGVWVNPEYHDEIFPNKQIYRPDHAVEEYVKPTSAQPDNMYQFELKKRWTDQAGSTYCQVSYKTMKGMWGDDSGVGLLRVDKAGKVLEANIISTSINPDYDYPESFDFEHMFGSYFIYYRK